MRTSLDTEIDELRAKVAEFEQRLAVLAAALNKATGASARAAIAATSADVTSHLRGFRHDLAVLEEARETMARLKRPHQSGNIGKSMTNVARVRISAGRSEGDTFAESYNKANYTLRSLAEALDVSHALLSRARKGDISISAELAGRVEKLTGFKASRKNWPKLRS